MRIGKILVTGMAAGMIVFTSSTLDVAGAVGEAVYEAEADTGEVVYEPPTFTDIKGHWAETLLRWVQQNRYADGYDDGSFHPDQPITEAEFLKMYYRFFEYPKAVSISEDWVAAPYRLAAMWHQPALGLIEPTARMEPVTRAKAAQLIVSGLGMNYRTSDSIVYLLGNVMLPASTPKTLQDFRGGEKLTRAEAADWLRSVRLKGMSDIELRPEEPSNPKLLPSLPARSVNSPDFTAVPVSIEDFGIANSQQEVALEFGSPRSQIEQIYGASSGEGVFNNERYGDLSVHYNVQSKMNSWNIDAPEEGAGEVAGRTFKNIQPGTSVLSDVIEAYGTFVSVGGSFGPIASYWYEIVDGRYIPRVSPWDIKHLDNGLYIGFSIDKTTLVVKSVHVSTARRALNPF